MLATMAEVIWLLIIGTIPAILLLGTLAALLPLALLGFKAGEGARATVEQVIYRNPNEHK